MSFGAVAAIGSIALGAYSSRKAGKAADKASKQQAGLDQQQLDLAKAADARAGELFKEYKDVYMPLGRQVAEIAGKDIDPNVEAGMAGADVEQQAAIQNDVSLRNLSRRGIDPSSGVAQEQMRLSSLATGRARAGAMTTARVGAEDRTLARKAGAYSLGSNLAGYGQANTTGSVLGQQSSRLSPEIAYNRNLAAEGGAQMGAGVADLIKTLPDLFKKGSTYSPKLIGPPN